MRFGIIVPAAAPSGGALFVRSYFRLDAQQLLTDEGTPARRRVRGCFLFPQLRRAVAPSLFAVIFDWTRNYSPTRAPPLDAEYEAVLYGLEQAMPCPDLSGRDGRVGRYSSTESGPRSLTDANGHNERKGQGLGGVAMAAGLVVVDVLFEGFGVSGNMVRALERMAAGNMSNFVSNSVAQWVFAPGCDNSGDTLSTASGFVGCADRMRF